MELFDKCCRQLGAPISDFEKIRIIFVATELIRSLDLGSDATSRLFRSVGIEFFARMFLNKLSITDDDDVNVRSAALAALGNFVSEPEIASDEQTLKLIPHVFDAIGESSIGSSELEDSVDFLKSIARVAAGRRALVSVPVLKKLPDSNFNLIASILVPIFVDSTLTFDNKDDLRRFNLFMTKMAANFERNNSHQKFELCELIDTMLMNLNIEPTSFVDESWPDVIWKGLKDILTSRIDDKLRSPALILSSTMLNCFGTSSKLENIDRFQLLLFHLSSIEIRMQLEDRTYDQVSSNTPLIVSCFLSLEVAVTSFLDSRSEAKHKDQIVDSFQSAANAVFSTIVALKDHPFSKPKDKTFVHAMIRFLSVGLLHDILPLDSSIVRVLPFVLQIAEETFNSYRRWFDENNGNPSNEPSEVLHLLLPCFCQLIALKECRRLILCRSPLLLDCLRFHWAILSNPDVSTDRSTSSTSAVSLIFQAFLACIIHDPKSAQKDDVSSSLYEFIVQILPRCGQLRPILTKGSVLGLLIVENTKTRLEENDSKLITIVDAFESWRRSELNEDESNVECMGRVALSRVVDKCGWLKCRLSSIDCSEKLE